MDLAIHISESMRVAVAGDITHSWFWPLRNDAYATLLPSGDQIGRA